MRDDDYRKRWMNGWMLRMSKNGFEKGFQKASVRWANNKERERG